MIQVGAPVHPVYRNFEKNIFFLNKTKHSCYSSHASVDEASSSVFLVDEAALRAANSLFVQHVGMPDTKPPLNEWLHPEPLRRIVHSMEYYFCGWHWMRLQRPLGGDLVGICCLSSESWCRPAG